MKVFKILFLLLITVLVPLNAQVTYFTNVSDKQIKTLQVKVAGEMFSDPFIELGGENRIEVGGCAHFPLCRDQLRRLQGHRGRAGRRGGGRAHDHR